MPTLKDIARHVGVSISTVSRVINNDTSRHISQETKSKIWKAAKELGYESPAPSAAGPKAGNGPSAARQIGCIVSVPQNKYNHPYFSPILAGIEKKLGELGYTLAYVLTMDEIQSEAAMRKLMHETKLEGIVIVEGIHPDVYEYIKKVVPSVVGIDISDPTVPVISYDRVQAAKSAVRHLIDQGHRRIAFIGGAGLTGDMEREKRFRGYQYAMQEAGLDVKPDWVINAGWDVGVSYSRMAALMDGDAGLRPTAVFAASDMMAISAMRAVAERGLRIPQDVAFVGLDNIEVSQFTSPPLTTIHIPKSEIGMMAAKVLVDQINGANPLPFKLFMPFELLVRQSSSYTRIGDSSG
ncbi:LacI family DNA-binding transcriptional regulator [Paenibacillus flagellatus]|uniref:LacI family transcriptional regulator n=1 Tax=Paenibacillus flagellatus TaxID=2211139 RepID=A0A2V5KX84_9BACL|nr:LacI family DNA-binding transcriptional regulator [Paenibacillus flagellatus]PYI56967.1 LacI family transcriptional regulator [Paenibacillus flagellatus]